MRSHYAFIGSLFLLTALPGGAFAQNALDFDGVNDKVTVPAASSLIVGGTGITLTCWVYPRNAATAYPDFDGFAGMRDETSADFYLLQVAPSNILEARFRNSAGQDFTMEYSDLQLNTWQFLALTYDGSELTLYADGVNVATAPANGNITNSFVDLLIGVVPFQSNDFFLNGRVDEVSLWNRGLSQAEVNCILANGVDVSDANVKLYFKMDQGVGGGNNAGISSLSDSKGQINGALSGFALNGNTSNFVASTDVGNNITATICPGGSYAFNGQQLSDAGVYGAAYDIGAVCDSLVTLTLNVEQVNVEVVQNGNAVTALAANASWQWLDCDAGYATIPGATGQGFVAMTDGSYAVSVTQNGCTDTSACVLIVGSGIREQASLHAMVYPVPATDQVRVDLGERVHGLTVTVLDVNGRIMEQQQYAQAETVDLRVAHLSAGLYFLQLRSAEGSGVYRLEKQ